MREPQTVRSAEEFGRVRLSRSFFMRDVLYSEIASIYGMTNLPDDPELVIAAGRELCEHLLEPPQATFGHLAIRSAHHSPAVNACGCAQHLSCASNETGWAGHIGTGVATTAAWTRWRASWCRGWSTAWIGASPGRPWRGGFTTICPTASCSSSQSSPHQHRLAREAAAPDLELRAAARTAAQARDAEP
jgi:hypothetical protein